MRRVGRTDSARSRVARALLLGLLLGLSPTTVVAERPAAVLTGAGQLAAHRLEDAAQTAALNYAATPTEPSSRWLLAEVRLWQGAYAESAELLAGVAADVMDGAAGETRRIARGTEAVTRTFAKALSPKGYFEIAYDSTTGEPLVGLAADALDRAYDAYALALSYRHPVPIRVELVESTRDLARMSPLTERDIVTTRTIAFAKYNKIVAVSPRATLFGYAWLDGLAHELAHLFIARLSQGAAPVWMHEGMARVLQGRWRGANDLRLSTDELAQLVTAARAGRLLGFSEMQPSFAKLGSAEAAVLAYAEVASFVQALIDAHGAEVLPKLLLQLTKMRSPQRALAEVTGAPFAQAERAWKQSLRALKPPASAASWLHLRQGGAATGGVSEEATGSALAQKYIRLGGLLRVQGQHAAAAIEYDKAVANGGGAAAARKLARLRMELGDHARAIDLAAPLLAADEHDVVAAVTLGLAYLTLGQPAEAAHAFEAAARMNPLDPLVRCGWRDALIQLADPTKQVSLQREQAACAALRIQPTQPVAPHSP